MTRDGESARGVEPRWPVALALVAVLALLTALPERLRLLPGWVSFAVAIVLLVPMAGVGVSAGHPLWLRLERTSALLFVVGAIGATLTTLETLIAAMLRRSGELSGIQLLASSVALWAMTVLAFSLLYWLIDRRGPEARRHHERAKPDWLFPQEGVPDSVRADWCPTFVDYLFLGFTTATAFSPAHALPLTSRASLLMMLESSISFVTLVVVAARSINILGS